MSEKAIGAKEMYKIIAPVKGYTGAGYGLRFENGVAETPCKEMAEYLRGKGYRVSAPKGSQAGTGNGGQARREGVKP